MLKNAYLDAKIGFDAEENEPSEICGIGSWYMYLRKGLSLRSAASSENISILRIFICSEKTCASVALGSNATPLDARLSRHCRKLAVCALYHCWSF